MGKEMKKMNEAQKLYSSLEDLLNTGCMYFFLGAPRVIGIAAIGCLLMLAYQHFGWIFILAAIAIISVSICVGKYIENSCELDNTDE